MPRALIPVLGLSCLLAACGEKKPPTPADAGAADAAAATGEAIKGPSVLLDGVPTSADWDDGDTFAVWVQGQQRPRRVRLAGFNTLESYGPVHRWGDWTAAELYALAKKSGEVAGSEVWTCTRLDGDGGYGRDVADCPALKKKLLSLGLAHVFAVDETPDPGDLATQKSAIDAKVGMWQKGVPAGLITSLHSLDEKEGQATTYNRIASPVTGLAPAVDHSEIYTACQEVCAQDSCMVYVPYKQRYGDSKAACLK